MGIKSQNISLQDNDWGGFEKYLLDEDQAKQTVSTYIGHMARYRRWYVSSYGDWQPVLYRANVLDFISYLRNIRKLQPTTINGYIAALSSYNNYTIKTELQTDMVVRNKDRIKIQAETVDPNDLDASDVEQFRQAVLVGSGKRDHALVTILAYAGLRISEAVNLEVNDIDLVSYELLVRKGKGDKVRIVYINDKIANTVREYLMEHDDSNPYLFPSRQGSRLDRTTVNRLCNKYSDKITPHKLRHFFGSQSQNEAGYSIHETAQQMGHSSTRTTLRYSHPDKKALKEIAAVMGLNFKQVDYNLFRAKNLIREALEKDEETKRLLIYVLVPFPMLTRLFIQDADLHISSDTVRGLVTNVISSADDNNHDRQKTALKI